MKIGDRVTIKFPKLDRYKYRIVFTEHSMGHLRQLPAGTIFIIKSVKRESVDDQCSSCLHMHMISKETCHYFNRGMGGSGRHDCPTYKQFKSKEVATLEFEDKKYTLMSSYNGDKFDVKDLKVI
jgi:hypothetical protein